MWPEPRKELPRRRTRLDPYHDVIDAMSKTLTTQGIDLSVFTQYQDQGSLYSATVYGHGSALQAAMQPMLDKFFDGSADNSIFATMQSKSGPILAGQS